MSLFPSSASLLQHVAVIMDGNGRWASARGLARVDGHRKGAEAARQIVESARDMGIPYLTLFAFSSENWGRPQDEVGSLMDLLRHYLKKEMGELHKSGARIKVIGDLERLPADIKGLVRQAEEMTQGNSRITVVIALSYGGRQDILAAVRRVAAQVAAGTLAVDAIDETVFSSSLATHGLPEPDLLIRTGGDMRVSNFLLWQMAYTELYFSDLYWPDFDTQAFQAALDDYCRRQRRFGTLPPQQVTAGG